MKRKQVAKWFSMTSVDWDWWQEFRVKPSGTISGTEVKKICTLHAKYFLHKLKMPCSCKNEVRRNFIQKYITDLNDLWKTKPPVRGGTRYYDEGLCSLEWKYDKDGNIEIR